MANPQIQLSNPTYTADSIAIYDVSVTLPTTVAAGIVVDITVEVDDTTLGTGYYAVKATTVAAESPATGTKPITVSNVAISLNPDTHDASVQPIAKYLFTF